MGWPSGLVWCSAGFGALSVTFGVLLYVFQDKLLYIPSVPVKHPDDNPHGYRNPLEQGISYEDMYATTLDGVTIHGWLLKSPNSDELPTLVYLHGNAGNIGFRLTNARQMQLAIGCNVLMVDYRGYGKSEGKPTQEGLLLDVEASLRALRENPKFGVDSKNIFLFGRSLGGAVALGAAERYPDQVRAVIVENTFLSVSHMVDELFPWLSSVKWLVLWLKWNSEETIRRLTRPVLFISGLRDELIPPWHMRALYNACPDRSGVEKRLITVADGGHNDTWEKGGQKCLRAMEAFVQEVMTATETPGDCTAPKEPNTTVKDGEMGGNGAREAPSGKGSINGEASAGAGNGDGPAVVTHVPLSWAADTS